MKNKIKLVFIMILPILAFIVSHVLITNNPNSICVWRNLTGHDCWGCGMTRAFHALCLLDFKSAYDFNPRIFIILPLFMYLWVKEITNHIKNIH